MAPTRKKATTKGRLYFERSQKSRATESTSSNKRTTKSAADSSLAPSLLSSPSKRPRTTATKAKVIVTPEVSSKTRANSDSSTPATLADEYVPTYLHKNLEYQRQGQKRGLPKSKIDAFGLVLEHFRIPEDLEQAQSKYGPLSGSSYEERVLQAYSLGKLKPKTDGVMMMICTACANVGHERDECPSLA